MKRVRSIFSLLLLIMSMILVYKLLEASLAVLLSNQSTIDPATETAANRKIRRKSPPIGPTLKEMFETRKKALEEACNQSNSTIKSLSEVSNNQFTHIFINEKYKLLYCGFRRAGLLNWKKVLLKMAGKTDEVFLEHFYGPELHDTKNFKTLDQLTDNEKQSALKYYTKFMVARHPLERLFSIFTDRFQNRFVDKDERETLVGEIKKTVREKDNNGPLSNDDFPDVTFKDFVKFILNRTMELGGAEPNETEYKKFAELYQTMGETCFPCAIKYDYIGDFDHIERDSNHVLKLLGSDISFPSEDNPGNTKERMQKYYKELSEILLKNVRKHYENDMQLFGYS
jgi:hypothetical protein